MRSSKDGLLRPLLLSHVDFIADDISRRIGRPKLSQRQKRELWSDLRWALQQYQFELSQPGHLKKFTAEFRGLYARLRALRREFERCGFLDYGPSSADTCKMEDQRRVLARHSRLVRNRMFKAIRAHGEAYAQKHGPHFGIAPRQIPRIDLREFEIDDEDERKNREYGSSRILIDLIEKLVQVERWMGEYDPSLVPQSASDRIGRRTHKPYVRLIGQYLPELYEKYFGPIKGPSNPRWVKFTSMVLKETLQIVAPSGTIKKYRKRMRESGEPFEMVLPTGPEWQEWPLQD
jgi:hypothetical protein